MELLKKVLNKCCKREDRFELNFNRQDSRLASDAAGIVASNSFGECSVATDNVVVNPKRFSFTRHDLSVIPEIRTSELSSSDIY